MASVLQSAPGPTRDVGAALLASAAICPCVPDILVARARDTTARARCTIVLWRHLEKWRALVIEWWPFCVFCCLARFSRQPVCGAGTSLWETLIWRAVIVVTLEALYQGPSGSVSRCPDRPALLETLIWRGGGSTQGPSAMFHGVVTVLSCYYFSFSLKTEE